MSISPRTEPYLVARIERAPEIIEEGVEVEAFIRAVRDLIQRLTPLIPELPDELGGAIQALTDLRQIVYLVATSVPISVAARQDLLEINSLPAKLRRLIELLQHEVAVRELGQKITRETEEEMSKAQRDYVLREQMKTIQRQLGEENPEQAEIQAFRRRLAGGAPSGRGAERSRARIVPPGAPPAGRRGAWFDSNLSRLVVEPSLGKDDRGANRRRSCPENS
ncbi:MAG: LON peptidase substrate-binding domain-containing protein [Candidatus Manganitrophus sp.]|nr:LON peptidase substrate-binding domain-containing protein [Candidatus Manganitrophus sp.]